MLEFYKRFVTSVGRLSGNTVCFHFRCIFVNTTCNYIFAQESRIWSQLRQDLISSNVSEIQQWSFVAFPLSLSLDILLRNYNRGISYADFLMKRDCASIKNHGEQHLSVTTPIETIDRVSPRWRRFALAFRRIFWTVDLDYRVVHVAQFAFLKGLSVHVSQETSRRDVSYFFCILAKLCRWIFCCKHCCISLWWKLCSIGWVYNYSYLLLRA